MMHLKSLRSHVFGNNHREDGAISPNHILKSDSSSSIFNIIPNVISSSLSRTTSTSNIANIEPILMCGYLIKRVNMRNTPRRRFFKLSCNSSHLDYYKEEVEMMKKPMKRIPLEGTSLYEDAEDEKSFWLMTKDSQKIHLEDTSQEGKERWMAFLSTVNGVQSSMARDLSVDRDSSRNITSFHGIEFRVNGEGIGPVVTRGFHSFDILCSDFIEARKFNVVIYSSPHKVVEEGNAYNAKKGGHFVITVDYDIQNIGNHLVVISLKIGDSEGVPVPFGTFPLHVKEQGESSTVIETHSTSIESDDIIPPA